MKGKVHAVIKLEDGMHTGTIKALQRKDKPYDYVDVIIEEDETKLDIKAGYPFYISANSSLGALLINFGAILDVNSEIDIEDHIKAGMRVQFMTKTVKKGDKEYCNVILDTVKPKR